MKINLLSFLFVFAVFTVCGQTKLVNGKLELLECEGKDKTAYKRCLYETFGNYLADNFAKEQIVKLKKLKKEGKRDTLKLSFGFVVGKSGRVLEDFFTGNFSENKDLKSFVLNKLQERFLFKLPLNNCGRPVAFYNHGVSLYFVPKDNTEDFVRILPYSTVDYYRAKAKRNKSKDKIDVLPVYKGCKKYVKKGNKALKSCMSQNVSKFVIENFNTKVGSELGLSSCAIRILAKFKFTKEGGIDDIEILAAHEALKKETIRVLKQFPKVKPGMKKGKPVNVLYRLPIIFKM